MAKKLLLPVVLLLFLNPVVCQKLMFTNFGTDKGLIQSDINDITQDKSGDIWVATNAGISVFDGKKFKNYDDIAILSSLRTFRIICDKKGVMWIATDNGLLKYDGRFSIFFKPDSKLYRRIVGLTQDHQNNKYFFYNAELYKIKDNDSIAKKLELKIPGLPPFTTFVADANNNFWLTTITKQAFRINNGILTDFPLDTSLCEANERPFNFYTIKIFNDSVPYFFTSKGIFTPQSGKLIPLQTKFLHYPKKNEAVSLFTSASETWLGTDNGIFKLSPDGMAKHFTAANGLSNLSVTSIFSDIEKNIWIGTNGNGIYKLSTNAISGFDEALGINLSNIESIVKIKNNDILLGTYSEGILRFSNKSFTKLRFPNTGMQLKYITGLAGTEKITLTGTMGTGLWEINNSTFVIKKSNINIPELYINAVLPYQKGIIVYAGGRIMYSLNNQLEIIARKEMIGALSLFPTNDSNLLFIKTTGTEILDSRLNVLKDNVFTEIKARISCLEFYKDQIIIGTIGQGLFLYDNKYRFIKKINSTSNIIYSLKAAGNNLFIGSNVGLSKCDINAVVTKQTFEERTLFNGECKEEGATFLNNDTLLVTSAKGLFLINIKENEFNTVKPIITLKSLNFINGSEILNVQLNNTTNHGNIYVPITIPHYKNELAIGLKGVSQTAPDAVQYQFILENYDKQWNATGNAELIRYTNLSPGSYIFKARLVTRGVSSPLLQIAFTIDRPFHSKWWFQVIASLLFIIFALLLLNVFNKLNHRFIETKMIKNSTDILLKKKTEIAELVDTTRHDLTRVKRELLNAENIDSLDANRYVEFYVNNSISRLDLLWHQNNILLADLHKYIEQCVVTDRGKQISISHNTSIEKLNLPVEIAEKIIRLFSLYIFYTAETSNASLFSLTSKLRMGNQLFLKIYSTETNVHTVKTDLYKRLKEYVHEMNTKGFSIEFVESQNLGNMIIVTLPLETAHLINEVSEKI